MNVRKTPVEVGAAAATTAAAAAAQVSVRANQMTINYLLRCLLPVFMLEQHFACLL